jgi:Ran GTPase-activating protein (RanGAP) involved in mRNA processing and transport
MRLVDINYPLRRVDLSQAIRKENEMQMLFDILSQSESLEELDEMQMLFDILSQSESLEELDFGYLIRNQKIVCYSDILKNSASLKKIYFGMIRFEDSVLSELIEALRENRNFQELHLHRADAEVSDFSSLAFPDMLKTNSTLRVLLLQNCSIMDGTISLIAESLKQNSSIEVIDLCDNCIANHGAQALAQALQFNFSIRQLDLSRNKIKFVGAKSLAKMLRKNQSIQRLNLSSNMLSEGTWILLKALKTNKSLVSLDIQFNEVEKEEYSSIVSNRKYKNLSYYSNHLKFLFCAYLSSRNVHFEGNILHHLLFPLLENALCR